MKASDNTKIKAGGSFPKDREVPGQRKDWCLQQFARERGFLEVPTRKPDTMNQKNSFFGFFSAVLLFAACGTQPEGNTLTVSIPLNQARQELVSIPYNEFVTTFDVDSVFRVVDEATGQEVPYQLETQGKGTPKQVLIGIEIPASGKQTFRVEAQAPSPVAARTFARYVPERYDDFAWENDVVAFRMYGKALEGRPDDAQGLDIWSKRTTDLVVDKWYAHGDYHTDHGEGLDYYSVGQTLGAGDIAPIAGGEVVYSKHYRNYEILDNGPLRTTFRLDYEPWQVGNQTVSVSKTYRLDAGLHFNRVEVTYSIDGGDSLPVVIGVARRADAGELLDEKDAGIFGYWEPEQGDYGITGVGVLLAEGGFQAQEDDDAQYLKRVTAANGQPLVYYNGGAWNKAGQITSAAEWFAYLRAFKTQLDTPLEVTFN